VITGGAGGAGYVASNTVYSGTGGYAGSYAGPGSGGTKGAGAGVLTEAGAGGSAGLAISGWTNVTLNGVGTIYGSVA